MAILVVISQLFAKHLIQPSIQKTQKISENFFYRIHSRRHLVKIMCQNVVIFLFLFLPLPLFPLLPRRTKLRRNEKKQKMQTHFCTLPHSLFLFLPLPLFPLLPRRKKLKRNEKKQKMQTHFCTLCHTLFPFFSSAPLSPLTQKDKVEEDWGRSRRSRVISVLLVTLSFFLCPSFLSYPEGQS
jgi:hypothetical protein